MRVRLFLATMLALSWGLLRPAAQSDCTRAEADAAYAAEQWEAAYTLYDCLLQAAPDDDELLFRRGYTAYEVGNSLQAETDYVAYLERIPEDSAALNNLANIYANRGADDEARSIYERAIASDPNNSVPYYNLGLIYAQDGDYSAALSWYNKGELAETPPDEAIYLGQAFAYQQLGDDRQFAAIDRYYTLVSAANVRAISATGDLSFGRGTAYRYEFSVQRGQEIRATLFTSFLNNFDALLLLRDSTGKVLAWDDDSGVNLNAVLSYTAPADATLAIIATHSNGTAQGEATLIVEVDAAAIGGATLASADEADAFSSYNLQVNAAAVVFTTAGDRLNLRSGAGLDFEILAKLPPDTQVTLLEGPRKRSGYNWWRIRTADGQEGWVVERVEAEQTLQPALVIGATVAANPSGDVLNVRAEANTSAAVVAELDDGDLVTVLEGPVLAEDFSWWRIRTADGVEGWAVERIGNVRTLVVE